MTDVRHMEKRLLKGRVVAQGLLTSSMIFFCFYSRVISLGALVIDKCIQKIERETDKIEAVLALPLL